MGTGSGRAINVESNKLSGDDRTQQYRECCGWVVVVEPNPGVTDDWRTRIRTAEVTGQIEKVHLTWMAGRKRRFGFVGI